jgi:KUP system potassium uptake protein
VPVDKRLEIVHLGENFHSVVAYYGFMQYPNVPRVLVRAGQQGLAFDMMDTSFFVGRVTIVPERKSRLAVIRTNLFETMHRNALPATEFFRIPPNRVIELVERFLGSNHIRLHRRACRTRCGLQGSD